MSREEAEAFFQRLAGLADRALRRGERYVVIVDRDMTGFSAAGRKTVAEVQARYVTEARNAATLAAFVPVDNQAIRGTMTALRWLSPRLVQFLQPVRSLDDALSEGLRALEVNGTPFKGDLEGLRRALGVGR